MVVALVVSAVLVNSVIRAVTAVVTTNARERSRREIAAYVAEGSITPEHGERLIKADVSRGSIRC